MKIFRKYKYILLYVGGGFKLAINPEILTEKLQILMKMTKYRQNND
jgi:hypothetical protein